LRRCVFSWTCGRCVRATAATHIRSGKGEVCAGNPGLVGKVDGNGSISEEGAKARQGGRVVINIVRSVMVANLGGIDTAVLSREVTNLAGLGKCAGAARCLEGPLLELLSCE
jgi:hypothetical protein